MRTTYCKSWTKNGLTILGQLKKQANTHSFIFDRPYLVWGERVSASYALASCSGRRSGGHLHHPCDPRGAMCRHLRLRMTGRIELRHRDSRGTDTWRTSRFHWASEDGISKPHAHLFLILFRELVEILFRIISFLAECVKFILKLGELPVGGL